MHHEAGYGTLSLDILEDPLLATAASASSSSAEATTVGLSSPLTPLTPSVSAPAQAREPSWSQSAAEASTSTDAVKDMTNTTSMSEREPDLKNANIMVHVKVYAIAEQYVLHYTPVSPFPSLLLHYKRSY